MWYIIRSTLWSRPNEASLECPSIHKKCLWFQWNLVLLVEVDEWCMTVCSMTRSRVKVTSPWKLEILPFSKAISFVVYNGADHGFLNYGTISKFCSGLIFDICHNFCVTWLWSWQKHQLWRIDHQSHTGLIYCDNVLCLDIERLMSALSVADDIMAAAATCCSKVPQFLHLC